jgi:predicted amidohydrolase
MKIAAAQMMSTSDRSQNLLQARELIEEAVSRGANLVALPENFAYMPVAETEWEQEAEPLNGPTVSTLQEWAAENDVWILGGSIALKKGKQGVTQSSLLIDSDGEVLARYDKMHLFDAEVQTSKEASIRYQESGSFQAGKKPVLAETPWGMAGLSICYDLRFPELYRAYSKEGAHLLFAPSAFTEATGKAHWDVLTRARAIENQAFLIAPAQWGENTPGRRTYGYARIVDPWGRIIAERNAGPGVILAQLNLNDLEAVRERTPALKHRRL